MYGPNVTGKHRASRIPLDYYKSADPVVRKKRLLVMVATVAAGLWIATMVLAPAKSALGSKRFSHGPICKQHASFGQSCSECHVSFSLFAGKDNDPFGRSAFPGDRKCLECHLGNEENGRWEGRFFATHQPTQNISMTPNCGVCHRDHRGEDVEIRRVAENQCTTCHKNLDKAIAGSEPRFDKAITSFADNHPDFRSAKGPDPGKLKFNHKYHMTKGIVLGAGSAGEFRVRQMQPGRQREALMARSKEQENAAVQLDCRDCHQNESGQETTLRPPSGELLESKEAFNKKYNADRENRGRWDSGELMSKRTDGAYLAPINFEQHCAACHPLTVGGATVTHRSQPDKLREEVGRFIEEGVIEFRDPKPLLQIGKPPASATGGGLDPRERIEVAMRMLLEGKRTCGECHVTEEGTDISIAAKKIADPKVPKQWFRHARFDHGKHEAKGITECSKCHPGAYASGDGDLMDAYRMPRKGAEAVMLPTIDNCRECHTPKPTQEVSNKGWAARSDCTECHIYHQGLRRE